MRKRLELSARIYLSTDDVEVETQDLQQKIEENKVLLNEASKQLNIVENPKGPSPGGAEVQFRRRVVQGYETDIFLNEVKLAKYQRLLNARRRAKTRVGKLLASVIFG